MDHPGESSTTDIHRTTLDLAKELIARRSITPDDGGCMDLISSRLMNAGFNFERQDRGKPPSRVSNLWAWHGSDKPLICLAGHLDVVPPGPADRWRSDPFEPTERDGRLFGRGAADMKTSVAAMVTAVERFVTATPNHPGTLALLLTSDEEGLALQGTRAVVQQLLWRSESIDACILGEPTSTSELGDTIKNGRRGSLSGVLIVKGVQCHIAYPERGLNPIHMGVPALAELASIEWDKGNDHFSPTSFQISHVHASTGANNTIPGAMEVWFNFRFSTESSDEQLKQRVISVLDAHGVNYDLKWRVTAAPFLSPPGNLVKAVTAAVKSVTGVKPRLSTSGGTSDGRFLATISREVVEFGPVSASIHAIDEHVRLADIGPLSSIYERAIGLLLAGTAAAARRKRSPSRARRVRSRS
jgi:succinyl-diaminopimelate desuccinylase